MRALIVEDDAVTRLRLTALITGWGHECIAVSDGVEAIERFEEFRPHILLTDWMMPRMDGEELVRWTRDYSEATDRYVYVIMLTGLTETSDLVKGLEAGADDFLRKPLNNAELRARLRSGIRIIELERLLGRKNRALLTANDEISAANLRMRQELEAAARIQASFLPSSPSCSRQARFSWHFEPCDELSGDTLNILPFDEDKVGLYVVDVSGHGVTAALLSVHLSRLFTQDDGEDSLVRQSSPGGESILEAPSEVASHLNQLFPFNPASRDLQYFTMLYGIYDSDERRFDYTSAGHPGPILVPADRSRGVQVLDADPPGVGFFQNADFTQKSIKLDVGDRLYLYTDGIFEIMDEEGEPFGETRLGATLHKQRDLSIEDSIQVTLDAAREWHGEDKFDDDISLVGMEVI